jgi:hypothetical protein
MTKRLMIILSAAALLFVGVGTASATDNVPTSGSCRLSANWLVTASGNWDSTHTVSGRVLGTLDYVVVNSPGAVHGGVDLLRNGLSAVDIPFNDNVATSGRYIERIDPDYSEVFDATVIVIAPSGATCSIDMHL